MRRKRVHRAVEAVVTMMESPGVEVHSHLLSPSETLQLDLEGDEDLLPTLQRLPQDSSVFMK